MRLDLVDRSSHHEVRLSVHNRLGVDALVVWSPNGASLTDPTSLIDVDVAFLHVDDQVHVVGLHLPQAAYLRHVVHVIVILKKHLSSHLSWELRLVLNLARVNLTDFAHRESITLLLAIYLVFYTALDDTTNECEANERENDDGGDENGDVQPGHATLYVDSKAFLFEQPHFI